METNLERSPVYLQLHDRLRTALTAEYQRGDQFLTEREVAQRFEVSRATANKALASLVSEGLLEFRRGIGTFVRRDVIAYDVRSLVSFTEKALAAGKVPATEVLTFRKVAAADVDPAICTLLKLAPEADSAANVLLWHVERKRLADRVPVILEMRYIVERLCRKLTHAQAEGSLYRAWTDKHSLAIGGAEEVIRAVLTTTSEARHLKTRPRSPALEVTAVGYLVDQTPLWWERTLYRGDQYEFQSRLGPIQSATPARGQFRS